MGYYKDRIYKQAAASGFVRNIDDIVAAVAKATGKSSDDAYKAVRKSMEVGDSDGMVLGLGKWLTKKLTGTYKDPRLGKMSRKARAEYLGRLKKEIAEGTMDKSVLEGFERVSKPRAKLDDLSWNLRRRIDEADMKAGTKVSDAITGLKKRVSKNPDQVKDTSFFNQDIIIDGLDDEFGEVSRKFKTKRLTAPIEKARSAALPMIGGFTVSNQLYKTKDKNTKGGDGFEQRQQKDVSRP